MSTAPRSSALITYTAWKALFLRTAIARLSARRFAWFWIIFEPLLNVVLLMLVFAFLRVRHINGIATPVWIMAGVLAFLAFRSTAAQSMNTIRPNRALYAFSQIRPSDPPLINAALQGFTLILVSIVLLAGAELIGYEMIPLDPLGVVEAMFGMWLIGVGYGLIGSVAMVLLPPVASAMQFLMRPLYILSGVMIPIMLIMPYPYRDWLLWNPLLHGLELAREGFAPHYHLHPDISVGYLYGWAMGLVFLGLALHVRYARRLAKLE
jgi:capsular polysaccharide transport system permease protein